MNTISDGAPSTRADAAAAGAGIYSAAVLSLYDWYVLGFSNRLVWRCPSRLMLEQYNQHVSARHLDVGVGTGYFLDRCRFPQPDPFIALADLNPNSLQATAARLARYQPAMHQVNVLEPMPIEPAGFESIGLNYLLHCLPGPLHSKGVVFDHLKPLLGPQGGVIFGATILGQGVPHNRLGRALMRLYNAKGIFGNLEDSEADLASVLGSRFDRYTLRVVGCVALFSARV